MFFLNLMLCIYSIEHLCVKHFETFLVALGGKHELRRKDGVPTQQIDLICQLLCKKIDKNIGEDVGNDDISVQTLTVIKWLCNLCLYNVTYFRCYAARIRNYRLSHCTDTTL